MSELRILSSGLRVVTCAAAATLALLAGPAQAAPVPPAGDDIVSCSAADSGRAEALSPGVRSAVVAYYAEKDLLPVRIPGRKQTRVDVAAQRVGTHSCLNPDGSTAQYVGSVPRWATEAVMVYAKHAPYPATEAPANYVTLARSPQRAWTVVGEGTAP